MSLEARQSRPPQVPRILMAPTLNRTEVMIFKSYISNIFYFYFLAIGYLFNRIHI